ncbi:MAG: hypothetical protein K2J63_12460 [Muribaculaceae bacterium]|nr:hypothetical protein [Muribaculaceae bacterium]
MPSDYRNPFYPVKDLEAGHSSLRIGGDTFLSPLYTRLGLPMICDRITKQSMVKYNLYEILWTLIVGRILYPGSKHHTYGKPRSRVNAPEDMYRALSLLSAEHQI